MCCWWAVDGGVRSETEVFLNVQNMGGENGGES